ncbi:MAG: NHLP family bacteriocin export ABC transporter peptidase/permease/ATPase subunit [Symploca sp. SIO3E6]|nr:NHLP family bacteriocin export ABC transporter peptidase/permease/ATPase subunit [Caldora sp. SIO3E6]
MKRVFATPTILQMEAVECGAAALGIILGYYGRIVPLAELRQACGVSRNGSNAYNIVQAAQYYGMDAEGYRVEDVEDLLNIVPPYIVHWNFSHYLVVEGFARDRVFLNDPAGGRRVVPIEVFDSSFTGVFLYIEPGADFKKGGRHPSVTSGLLKRLGSSAGAVLYCALAGFLLTIPGLALSIFGQIFVDNILLEGKTDWLNGLLLAMASAVFLQGILTLLRLRYLRKLRIKLSVQMSSEFLWHLLRLPIGFYAQRYAGEISSRLRINDRVAGVLSGQLATTLIDTVMVGIYGVILWNYDSILTAIGVSFSGINILALQWVARRRVDASLKIMQNRGKVSGRSIAGLQSIETLKASGLESDFFTGWASDYAASINSQQELAIVNQKLGILPTLLTSLTSLLILVIGGWRVMEGELTIGMLMAFQTLMGRFQSPVNSLIGFGSTLQELRADLNRLDDVLANPLDPVVGVGDGETRGRGDAGTRGVSPIEAIETIETGGFYEDADGNSETLYRNPVSQVKLEINNLTFGYAAIDPPLVEGFNLSLEPGQRVALVGKSGSGKSTIAKLIAGLYQPWSGEILFNGINRQDIPRQVLIQSLSMVEQEILLFGGTVRENLTLWNPDIPDECLVKACEDAAIYDRVMELSGGLDGDLLEGGANFSGGQRQRLQLARALVNNPALLILDEATSALDNATEKEVVANIRQRGCSCVIVAHRLSTIVDCDEIVVLGEGKVVQRGTHEVLLSDTEGVYAQLLAAEV